MLIKIYPALSAAIGGRDRVDGRWCGWMTRPATFLIGKHHPLVGAVSGCFRWGKIVLWV